MSTNCTGERVFFEIENNKEPSEDHYMLEPRLTAKSLMSIESDKLDEIDLSEIIQSFATAN